MLGHANLSLLVNEGGIVNSVANGRLSSSAGITSAGRRRGGGGRWKWGALCISTFIDTVGKVAAFFLSLWGELDHFFIGT